MPFRISALAAAIVCLTISAGARAVDRASGSVTVQKLGAITAAHAAAYSVRDMRNPRTTRTEILLSDVAVDPSPMQTALDPHMVAINAPELANRNYVLLWVSADGAVTMNATFSKTMTQFLNDTNGGLKVTWTTKSDTRLEGRLFSATPLKTMDGTTYSVDLTFGVDVPKREAGQPLPAGGGDAGKALTTLLAAAEKKDWDGIRAASSPGALKMFDKSYNSAAENADGARDLLKAWIPTAKLTITGGELHGDVAVLDVEGELFPGQMGLSLVRMVRSGATWQFDQAVRAGMLR
jgi:hypothetical protein